ncbi:MAG: DUF6350 family protein [Promicromonosporaceae bacterium]|nr:DUF6350 family protein [Promicromonosporaceae bacterium]
MSQVQSRPAMPRAARLNGSPIKAADTGAISQNQAFPLTEVVETIVVPQRHPEAAREPRRLPRNRIKTELIPVTQKPLAQQPHAPLPSAPQPLPAALDFGGSNVRSSGGKRSRVSGSFHLSPPTWGNATEIIPPVGGIAATEVIPVAEPADRSEQSLETPAGPQPRVQKPRLGPNRLSPTRAKAFITNIPEKLKAARNRDRNPDRQPWHSHIGPVLTGVWSALKAFLIGYAILALLTLVAMSADGPQASWAATLNVATRLWLLGHGGRAAFGDVPLAILPLGYLAITTALLWLCARHLAARWTAVVGATTSYAAIAAALAWGSGAPLTTLAAATGGALVITFVATLLKVGRHLPVLAKLQHRAPLWLAPATRASVLALVATLTCATVLTATWAVLGRGAASAATETLSPSVIGMGALGLTSLAFLPNWVIWVASWLVGPGFMVGAGTSYAPGSWYPGPLPALPLASALPPSGWVGPLWQWVPALVLLAGAGAGWYLWRELGTESGRQLLWGALCATGFASGGMALLQWAARGGIGEGRLTTLGASPLLVAALFGVIVAGGIAMVLVGCLLGSRAPVVRLAMHDDGKRHDDVEVHADGEPHDGGERHDEGKPHGEAEHLTVTDVGNDEGAGELDVVVEAGADSTGVIVAPDVGEPEVSLS